MTGGTARMLSRRPTPASQSRPAATQNSRMALPASISFAKRSLRKWMDCRVLSAFTRVFNALCPAMTVFGLRRALEARERFVDLEAARLSFFALLALAFDHILRRAGDEVGIGELGVDAGDVGVDARHFLLEARFLGGEVDHPLERQRRHLPAHDELHGALRRAVRERNIGEAGEAAHDVGPPRR